MQLVLLKDKKKLFTLDGLGYEPEAVACQPRGGTVAVGGAVSDQSHVFKQSSPLQLVVFQCLHLLR